MNGKCLEGTQLIQRNVTISSGKIVANGRMSGEVIDCKGLVVCPGFIDLQVNGVSGIDFTHSPEKISIACQKLLKFGVTSFLATLITQPYSYYTEVADRLNLVSTNGAECLGIHLEGPFLNPARPGAHKQEDIQTTCPADSFAKILKTLPVKFLTQAPEIPGVLQLFDLCKEMGISLSCGHSEASCDIMEAARCRGLKSVTHLFNAMKPLHHRYPGPIGYTLATQALFYTLILDMMHVDPYVVRLAYNAHPHGLFLVSDQNALVDAKESSAVLGSSVVELSGGRPVIRGTATLAGSSIPLNTCLRNLISVLELSFEQLYHTVTTVPAKVLGISDRKGKIHEGFDADLVLFDEKRLFEVDPIKVFVGGRCLYNSTLNI
jgi:N-acetylglucosamine-6-phosphate deacetylase